MFDWVLNSSITCNVRQKFINERLCFFFFQLYQSLTSLIFIFNEKSLTLMKYHWYKTKQCQMTTISQQHTYHLFGRAENSSEANRDLVQLIIKTTEPFAFFFFLLPFFLREAISQSPNFLIWLLGQYAHFTLIEALLKCKTQLRVEFHLFQIIWGIRALWGKWAQIEP